MTTLVDLRLQKFWSQKQLASEMGVSYQMVQRWERGRAMPQPKSLRKLAEVFGIDGAALLAAVKESARQKPADAPTAHAGHGDTPGDAS